MTGGFTEEDMIASTHEAAHFAAAVIEGLVVDQCRIDRHASDMENFGATATSFRDDDARTLGERAAVRARVALAGVMVQPGRGAQSDSDVTHAYGYARIALRRPDGSPPPVLEIEAWVHRRSDEVAAMLRTKIFRRILDDVSYVLLEERSLTDPQRLTEVLEAIQRLAVALASEPA